MQEPAPSPCQSADDTQRPEEPCSRDDSNQATGPWARLVSVQKSYPNIEIWEDDTIVGRTDVEGHKEISKSHFRIFRDSFGQVSLQNLSGNGTLVKGIALGKDELTIIKQGDEVVLGPHPSGYPLYIVQILSSSSSQDAVCNRKRTWECFDTDTFSGSNTTKKTKVSKNIDEFKCCICLSIWHDVVSAAPCLHNFCNGCFSEWYKKSTFSRWNCPQCREPVLSVKRNHTLHNLVEELLEEFPSLKRAPEDIANLDRIAIIGNDSMKLGRGVENNSFSSDDMDDDDEEWDSDCCPQCVGPNGSEDSVFHCGPQTIHLTCSACNALMPERLDIDVPQRCAGCHRVFCDMYWHNQHVLRSNGVVIGCIRPGMLKTMNEQRISEIPSGTFRGNTHERDVTKRYISEQSLQIQDVLLELLSKMDRGEIEKPSLSEHLPTFTAGSYFCNQCADSIIQHLFYKYRLSIPKNELPPDAAGREDCWYGRLCRTQLHKVSHAQKYNHACEPGSRFRQA